MAASVAALIPSHTQDYVAYRSMYLIVGFVGTFVMYPVCHTLRKHHVPLLKALAACVAVGYVLSIPASAAIFWSEIRFGGSTAAIRWDSVLAGGVGVTFVYVAWSAFYFGTKHYQDSEHNRSRLLASEALAREAQLRALRYQLQPHFLFNTLNAISTLVLDNERRKATQMIAKLAALLRTTLDSPEAHQISLAEEMAVTEEYLAIEQVRFGTGLSISCEIDEQARNSQVPRFLLQPLVENAIRHGIAKRRGGGRIEIRARIDETLLRVEIENEGGKDIAAQALASQAEPGDGLGLSNTRLRLQQIYGDSAVLQTGTTSAGRFLVRVSLPSHAADHGA
jgi:LytS/YehU family sensor histidine kinase